MNFEETFTGELDFILCDWAFNMKKSCKEEYKEKAVRIVYIIL